MAGTEAPYAGTDARSTERARRAAAVYGASAVTQAAKIDYRRLSEGMAVRKNAVKGSVKANERPKTVPAYSRLEIPAREAPTRPLCEAETPSGVKIRVFSITPETIGLLSALSEPGRAL